MALVNSYIDDKNRQVKVYEVESLSAYNERMNTNYDFEEHEEKKWNKADIAKFVKDSLIGLVAIIVLTMIVAALRFAFVAKVDTEYILAYTLEYPKLVMWWIIVLWILWMIIHLLYRVLSDRKVFYEYFTVEQMKAMQRRNKKNRTAAYEGLTADETSERYRQLRVIGYIRKAAKFKEDKGTDILEIQTSRISEDTDEPIIERYNIQKGKHGGKIIGYIKVDEDEYVAIVEHQLYPFVISGIAVATVVCGIVTTDIQPIKTNSFGEVQVSDTMQKLENKVQKDNESETLYLWIPAFASKIQVTVEERYIPLRNFSENQFRDEMWGIADELREKVALFPDEYSREEMIKKFSITYLTLTNTEIENCVAYIWGDTDMKLRESYENQFSFRYDIIVDEETAAKMNVEKMDVPKEVEKLYSNGEVAVYSTYPELLPPGTVDYWDAYEMFNEAGEYKIKLRVVPYLTKTLEEGSPRDVITTVVINK